MANINLTNFYLFNIYLVYCVTYLVFSPIACVRASVAHCRAVSRVVNSPRLDSLVLIKLLI
jgi:hypothetical protein